VIAIVKKKITSEKQSLSFMVNGHLYELDVGNQLPWGWRSGYDIGAISCVDGCFQCHRCLVERVSGDTGGSAQHAGQGYTENPGRRVTYKTPPTPPNANGIQSLPTSFFRKFNYLTRRNAEGTNLLSTLMKGVFIGYPN
jgi:hypothetical protein